jgi:hypothetical protein
VAGIHATSDPRLGVITLIALLAIVTVACQGRPIPLAAARGTSVLIPIGGGGVVTNEGVLMGYGSPTLEDRQRGRLRLWLDSNPDVELPVRGVARVRADRASPAGLSQGSNYVLGDQVVAVVDVPATAPLGDWGVYARRYTFQWNGATWQEQELPLGEAPSYQGSLEVLPEVRSQTPLEAFLFGAWQDVDAFIPELVPHPKFRFVIQAGGGPGNAVIGSARFTVAYPQDRLAIHGIVAEPVGADSIDWGPSALISFSEPTAGVLDVYSIAPAGVVKPAFGIVFELTHPSDPPASGGGPVSTADFVISNVQAWDVSGAVLSPTVPAVQKKIF